MTDPVETILAHHGIRDRWVVLEATGVANRIYATRDVVLRIATDHPDALTDARTESVAAPVARAAGVPVPRLLAFDDSRKLVDRPYSLWERVQGETLGVFAPRPQSVPDTWRVVGRPLAQLHSRVEVCPDPHGWLDRPERFTDIEGVLATLASRALIVRDDAAEIEEWIKAIQPAVAVPTPRHFPAGTHGWKTWSKVRHATIWTTSGSSYAPRRASGGRDAPPSGSWPILTLGCDKFRRTRVLIV